MNAMEIAYAKAIVVMKSKAISKSGKKIGKAFKSIYSRING